MESAIAPHAMEEVLEELTGESRRKWALILFAFVVGFAVAVSVIRFRMRRDIDILDELDADGMAGEAGSPASEAAQAEPFKTSRWSGKRAQIARADAGMRARVGRIGSRLDVRQHAPSVDAVAPTDAELDH